MYTQNTEAVAALAKYGRIAGHISTITHQLSAAYRAAVAAQQLQEVANVLRILEGMRPPVRPQPLQPVPKKSFVYRVDVHIINHK